MKPAVNTLPYGWAGAIVVHVVLLAALFGMTPPDRKRDVKRPPVKVSLVTRTTEPKAKPPEPPPEPPKAEPPKPTPAVNKRPTRRAKPKARPKQAAPPPKPAAAPPQPVKPRVRRFAISMEATVSAGGVAVPTAGDGERSSGVGAVGGDKDGVLGGRPTGKPAPKTPKPAPQPKVVQATQVTVLPKLVGQPSSSEMRRVYPRSAREKGLEGNVRLKILVSVSGKVERVRVLRRAGNGFDEAAVSLVKKFKFSAGKVNGRSVAVWIPWTYRFRLSG